MSTDVTVYLGPEDQERVEQNDVINEYLALDPEEFGGMSAKVRDIILFSMLRETLGEVRALADKVQGYEDKAMQYATPEGRAKLMEMVMGQFSGGMLGMF